MPLHSARLVWATPDCEAFIARIARVSNPDNERNPDCERLLKYLIRNRHWSPFEMATIVVEIYTTLPIATQLIRHRSFSFQQFSHRYATPLAGSANVVEVVSSVDLRLQDSKNRQKSIEVSDSVNPIEMEAVVESFRPRIRDIAAASTELYDDMIAAGVAKECARGILPSGSPTRLYMTGTVRSWIHYCAIRHGNGTQSEHSSVAKSIFEILKSVAPVIASAAVIEE